jgi:hypothetical protein
VRHGIHTGRAAAEGWRVTGPGNGPRDRAVVNSAHRPSVLGARRTRNVRVEGIEWRGGLRVAVWALANEPPRFHPQCPLNSAAGGRGLTATIENGRPLRGMDHFSSTRTSIVQVPADRRALARLRQQPPAHRPVVANLQHYIEIIRYYARCAISCLQSISRCLHPRALITSHARREAAAGRTGSASCTDHGRW